MKGWRTAPGCCLVLVWIGLYAIEYCFCLARNLIGEAIKWCFGVEVDREHILPVDEDFGLQGTINGTLYPWSHTDQSSEKKPDPPPAPEK